MKRLLLSAAALVALTPLLASAQSADLSMSGAIIPTSCAPSFSGGGIVNLGRNSASGLNTATQTEIRNSDEFSLTITCDTPLGAGLAFKVHDNNAATLEPTIIPPGGGGFHQVYGFGLGAHEGVNIGSYSIFFVRGTVDGALASNLILNHFPGGTLRGWQNSGRPVLQSSPQTNVLFSLGSAAAGPTNGQDYVFTMRVRPAIRPSDDLNIIDEFPLAGSATFTLVYL